LKVSTSGIIFSISGAERERMSWGRVRREWEEKGRGKGGEKERKREEGRGKG
jgi:hypothetical protein